MLSLEIISCKCIKSLIQNVDLIDSMFVSSNEYGKVHNALQISHNRLRQLPVPLAARSKARTVFDSSNTGIVSSNLARGTDVFRLFSVLCCPV